MQLLGRAEDLAGKTVGDHDVVGNRETIHKVQG
jgi:hypothetical protein